MTTAPHILIANDHHAIRGTLARAVALLYPSALITAVTNGAEALATYVRQGADLLITDGNMPMMGGIDLIRALRTHQATIPILLISFDVTLQAAGLAAGASQFLGVPFELAEFRQTLIALLPT